jgi:Glu-tRNA(Gln) amidotransferase subunit E-like FAD-binding protein
MNFWGTKFYINDPETGREMAIMSRSFIRMKNNWIIHVTDPLRLKQKNIDPRVLMTVLAVQGEIEDWSQQYLNTYLKSSKNSQMKPVNQLPPVLAALTQEKSQITQILKPEQLEMLVNEIEEGFRVSSQQTEELSNDERIQAFSMYCENLLKSPDLPQDKKEAIQTLLNLRLYGHP